MLTFNELERVAYIQGNTTQADNFDKCSILADVEDNLPLEFTLDHTIVAQLDAYVEKQIERQCPNYAEYKQFFEDCFMRLNGHYPCHSVTSDYDCGVIFNAIDKGEAE